jgi:hypothetical protein
MSTHLSICAGRNRGGGREREKHIPEEALVGLGCQAKRKVRVDVGKVEDKPYIVESCYTGTFQFDDWGQWIKWRGYKKKEDAEKAIESLNRKFTTTKFRLKPGEENDSSSRSCKKREVDNS